MSDTMGADEFLELMPHIIKVTSKSLKDDFSYNAFDLKTVRTYRCLVDENDNIQKTPDGVTLGIGITAYANAIPIGETEARDILPTDKVEVVLPVQYATRLRPVKSISRHWWIDGTLHNMEVRLS